MGRKQQLKKSDIMVTNETFSRVRQIHATCGPCAGSSIQSHKTASRRTPQTSGVESESSRPKAKEKAEGRQTLRFLGARGNVGILVDCRFFSHLAGDFGPSATLEQAPEILKSVGEDVALHIRFGVIDNTVLVITAEANIAWQGIGKYCGACLNIFADFLMQGRASRCFDNVRANLTLALQNPHDDCFTSSTSSADASCLNVLVHVSRLAADVSLVNFNFAAELSARLTLQRKTNALKHEPSRLLANSSGATDFVTRNAILAVCQHPHRKQPLVESDWRILENATGLNAELRVIVSSLALPDAARLNKANVSRATARADDTVRPTPRHEIVQAVVRIGEVNNCVLQSLWYGHEPSIGQVV